MNDEQISTLESIIEEEDLDILTSEKEEGYVTVMNSVGKIGEDVRLVGRFLQELHDVAIEDIETAVETVDDDTEVSWL